jgi:hypothetical protein
MNRLFLALLLGSIVGCASVYEQGNKEPVNLSPACEDPTGVAQAIIRFVWPKLQSPKGSPALLYVQAFGQTPSKGFIHALDQEKIIIKATTERKDSDGVALWLDRCRWRTDGILIVDASISFPKSERTWRGFSLKKEGNKWVVLGWEALPPSV